MAEERRAVAQLDLALLETSTTRKHTLCTALAAWRDGGGADRPRHRPPDRRVRVSSAPTPRSSPPP
jgi:hypothetical protein